MYPPIFATCSADVGVQALLGNAEACRLYPFGEAVEGVTKPYAVWQTVGGGPENCISGLPVMDSWSVQVDVYSSTATEARTVAEALRDAIEPVAHIISWAGESRDSGTKNYRYSFDCDWWIERDLTST